MRAGRLDFLALPESSPTRMKGGVLDDCSRFVFFGSAFLPERWLLSYWIFTPKDWLLSFGLPQHDPAYGLSGLKNY